jgi:hypothetical protein
MAKQVGHTTRPVISRLAVSLSCCRCRNRDVASVFIQPAAAEMTRNIHPTKELRPIIVMLEHLGTESASLKADTKRQQSFPKTRRQLNSEDKIMKTMAVASMLAFVVCLMISGSAFAQNAYRSQPAPVVVYPYVVGPTYVPSYGYFPYTMASPNQYSYHNPNWGIPAPFFPAEVLYGPKSIQRFWSLR